MPKPTIERIMIDYYKYRDFLVSVSDTPLTKREIDSFNKGFKVRGFVSKKNLERTSNYIDALRITDSTDANCCLFDEVQSSVNRIENYMITNEV